MAGQDVLKGVLEGGMGVYVHLEYESVHEDGLGLLNGRPGCIEGCIGGWDGGICSP